MLFEWIQFFSVYEQKMQTINSRICVQWRLYEITIFGKKRLKSDKERKRLDLPDMALGDSKNLHEMSFTNS